MTQSPPRKPPARKPRTQAVRFQPPTAEDPALLMPRRIVKKPAPPTVDTAQHETGPLMDPEPEVEEEQAYATSDADDSDDETEADQKPAESSAIDTEANSADAEDDSDVVIGDSGLPVKIRGVNVEREEVLFGISPAAPFRYTRFWLADGTSVIACRDCWFYDEKRGPVMQHRNAVHGARYGHRKPKVALPAEPGVIDLVLEPRDDGTPAPASPMDWTLRELLALMPSIGALGDLVDRLEIENAHLRTQLAAHNSIDAQDAQKIAAYEPHRQEIMELRKFKRETVKKFAALGFKFAGEEE